MYEMPDNWDNWIARVKRYAAAQPDAEVRRHILAGVEGVEEAVRRNPGNNEMFQRSIDQLLEFLPNSYISDVSPAYAERLRRAGY